ncbi:MAG: hypothetical protein K6C35_02045 [Eubacterium sp.]|nr:hypothetical protein [Eubacterium sp.]
MKKIKKGAAVLIASAMALSLAACGNSDKDDKTTEAPKATEKASDATTSAPTTEKATEAPAAPAKADPSVNFEDGNFAFSVVSTKGDKSNLSVTDFAGSKALKAENTEGNNMFIAINVDALLGENVANLASIQMDIGTESTDGQFYASSGNIYSYVGEDNHEVKGKAWSVYLENANPKTVTFDVSDAGFVAGKTNYIILSKETDNAGAAQNLYIDNIAFLDASGATLAADTAAEFGSPVGFGGGIDRSNLSGLINPVNFDGFAVKEGAWAQNGLEIPQNVLDALVPGSAVEISYKSETGKIWIVMPDSAAGWMRVGVGDADGSGQQYAYINNSGNTAQITYEQLAAVLGEDKSTWGARMQCESDGAWEVTSVKVGTVAPSYTIAKGAVEFPDFAVKAGAWAQDGKEMPQEIIDALQPGSVVEISYKSDTGNIWLVMPDAAAGWMRVGVGMADGSGQGFAVQDGSKAYITYETIAQICGEDKSTWGARMQCESDGNWEVTGIRVGAASEFKAVNNKVDLGAAVKGGGWAQDGVELSPEAIEALQPGTVISISYKSDNGELWIVMPDAAAGWSRVGVGDWDGSGVTYALYDGNTCQISYEMIAQVCGEDKSTWGNRIQFEASGNWEVTSAAICNVK